MTSGEYVPCEQVYPGTGGLPALPQVSVVLRAPYPPYAQVRARAVLDTGSTHTILSEGVRYKLQLIPGALIDLVSDPRSEAAEGTKHHTCAITVSVDGVADKTVEAVIKDSYPDVLLGRDILNYVRLTLEAPVNLVLLEPSSKCGAP